MKLPVILLLGIALITITCQNSFHQPAPPVARKIAHFDTTLGDVRQDDYYWLRQRNNPDVIQYLQEENRYTDLMMKPTADLQKKLFDEMVGRIRETDLSVPVRHGDYFYYTRTEEGKQYKIHCRKKGSLQADEEIILDENELAAGKKYFEIGVFAVSPDHNFLAFSADTSGSEQYTIHIKDLTSGKILADAIPNTYYSLAWASDNRTFFYTVLDAAMRPFKVFRHTVGQAAEKDRLVHHETDEKFFLTVERSRSGGYIFLNIGSQVTSEVRYIPADRPLSKFRVFAPRQYEVEYALDHNGNDFYILTNEQAINFKLMKTSVRSTPKKYWQEVIAHRPHVKLDQVELFKDFMVVIERQQGLKKIRIRNLRDQSEHFVDFGDKVYTLAAGENPEFDSHTLRFVYSSLKTPRSVYDYDMISRQRELMKQDEVLGGYDPEAYDMDRIMATADDGTRVPISLLYKKGLKKDGRNPAFLYAYGSYGSSREPWFSSNIFSLVDRGFVYAIAHIRGGGDLGRQWYLDGKLLKKKNTFTDFIACAEHLINEKYTSPDHLAIAGGSAGGLLMGAVVNMRPDLFKAVVARVPFVDVINTMLDESIPLTVIEYDEWGNPHEEKYYRYMKSYSPYDNVEAKDYPNLLITAGLNDPRVQYWEPAKWTAKLRALKTDDNWLLLKTNMGAGHGGASGRYDYLKETAFYYAFILNRLGVD